MRTIRLAALTGTFFIGVSLSTIAYAQNGQAEQQPEPKAASGNDIVVTAQRREQRLQEVPLAISAVTGSQLNSSGINNTEKLSTVVPGLVMTQQRTSYSPYLRGVGTQNVAVGDEPNVATYVDGVYMASAAAVVFDMNNISRIEVLRGPQGTLFGRNATGGLISIITRNPSHDTSVQGSIGYGSYNTISGNLYATTGLSDNAAIDFAFTGRHQSEGFGRNVTLNRDVYFHRSWGVRSKLQWEPSDTVSLTLAGDYSRKTSDFGSHRGVLSGSVTVAGATPAGIVVVPGTSSNCFRCVYDTITQTPVQKNYGLSLVASVEMGNATLTSTTAWRYILANYVTDTDAGAARVSDVYLREHTNTLQQEFLLNGDVGHLNYTAGLFLFYSSGEHDPLLLRNEYNGAANLTRITQSKTSSYAPFAQLSYDFGQGTTVTGGVRYTSDKREFHGAQYGGSYFNVVNPAGDGVLISRQDESKTYNKVTWRGALNHKVTDNFMVYGTISRGFKSGAFNSTAIATPAVRPETLDAYEVGFKSDLFDRQLTLNVSAFHYNYKDIQLFSVVGSTAFLLNAGAGKIDGVDVEATFRPNIAVGNLSLTAKAGFLPKAEYTSFPNAQFFYPRPAAACGPATSPNPSQSTGAPTGGNLQCVGDASGHRMIKAPKATMSFIVDYSVPVGDNSRIAFNGTVSHNSGFFFDPDSRLRQNSFQLVNASLGYYFNDDRFGVRVYGTNIFNKEWISSVQTSGFTDSTFIADPRTYGVSLEFKF